MQVLIADNLTIFRAAVRNLLEREHDFKVLEAPNFRGAVATVNGAEIDVVLLELDLLPPGALEAVQMLRPTHSTTVIVWSLHPQPESVLDAIRAGADGYLDKQIAPDELSMWVRRAGRGESVMSGELTKLMIAALHTLDERERSRRKSDALSLREREVLEQIAGGAGNRQVAQELTISEFTVKRHVQNILRKLGVGSRREAAAFYRAAYGDADWGVARA